VNRFGNSYVVTAVSAWGLLVAAMVAFGVLVSVQALHDWPSSGLGIHLGGGGGSDTSGSAKQAVAGARAIEAGTARIGRGVATGPAAPDRSGKSHRPGGTGTTGGDGVAVVSPAYATTGPVRSPPPNAPAGGDEVAPPEGGGGPVTPTGGGGGEGAATPPETGSTAPPAGRAVKPAAIFGPCRVRGAARFSPGLDSSSQAFGYELNGSLECCRSIHAGAPASGALSVGAVISEQVTNSVTGATDTVEYQEPIPTGSGGCEGSATEGQALETWADGTETVVSYATIGTLTAARLSGSVAPSMTLTAVNPALGDPTTFTIETTRYAGESMLGMLAFQPPDPSICTTQAGATTMPFSGSIGPVSP
jgi:hypothetical protein